MNSTTFEIILIAVFVIVIAGIFLLEKR